MKTTRCHLVPLTLVLAGSAFLAGTVDAHPKRFISGGRHVVGLTDSDINFMGYSALSDNNDGHTCQITDKTGEKDASGNYVIGTTYEFLFTTSVSDGLGMVTSVGEGTASKSWYQTATSGKVAAATVQLTPTTEGEMSVHALCSANNNGGVYLATPLSGTIAAIPPPCAADVCGAHGATTDTDSTDRCDCECTDGFTGELCETEPDGLDGVEDVLEELALEDTGSSGSGAKEVEGDGDSSATITAAVSALVVTVVAAMSAALW